MKAKNILILVVSVIFFIISVTFFIYVMNMNNVNEENNISSNNFGINKANIIRDDDTELEERSNMSSTKNVVILEVHSKVLTVMEMDNEGLYTLGMGEQGNIGYKKGQELLVYYDGYIAASFPGQISNVGKIEITKEKTDITIPDKYLKYYDTPTNEMSVSLLSLTRTGASFEVSSEIEIPSDHLETYTMDKTGSYTSGGLAGISYCEKLKTISDFPIEDTITATTTNTNTNSVKYEIDWTNTYGELPEFDERRIYI